jgi:integrase
VQNYLAERQLQEKERIRALETRKRQGSFAQLLESYLTAMQAKGRRSVYYVRKSFDRYVTKPFPELVSKKASEITSKDIHLILRRMLDDGITTQTNRLRSYLHAAFKHGITQDIDPRRYAAEGVMFNVAANPVSSVPRQADFERVGEHVISETEIPVIWKELPKKSLVAGAVIKLALATGQRVGELVRLKRADFDLNERLMLIPGAVSKNGIDHLVPLNDLALESLSQLFEQVSGSQLAFPGLRLACPGFR